MKKPKIFFGIAIYRNYEPESRQSLYALIEQGKNWEMGNNGKLFELYKQSNINIARNFICKNFLESKDDYLFLFDVDIVSFTDYAIDMLVEAKRHIIGAPYVFKQHPVKPAFETFDGKYDLRGQDLPIRVKHVSGGFTLYSREVMQKITNAHKHPFETYEVDGQYLSEDWAINNRARAFNIESYIHPKIMLGHLGMYPFSMLDYYSIWLDNPVKQHDKTKYL